MTHNATMYAKQAYKQYKKSHHKHDVTMIYDRWNHSQAPPKKPPTPVIYPL